MNAKNAEEFVAIESKIKATQFENKDWQTLLMLGLELKRMDDAYRESEREQRSQLRKPVAETVINVRVQFPDDDTREDIEFVTPYYRHFEEEQDEMKRDILSHVDSEVKSNLGGSYRSSINRIDTGKDSWERIYTATIVPEDEYKDFEKIKGEPKKVQIRAIVTYDLV